MPVELLSAELRQKLERHDGPVELCDTDGRLFGYFTPTKAKQYDADPGISDEELDRREAAGGGRKLTDILRDLEGRA